MLFLGQMTYNREEYFFFVSDRDINTSILCFVWCCNLLESGIKLIYVI